jgi:C4-dicarboxylate-specific signal transduction histidine kinase
MGETGPPAEWLEAANLHATVAQLLSTVIHQVNNALQTIGGHAELLKTDPGVTETTKRRARTITEVTDRTAEMLASFHVFTRPSAGLDVCDLRDVAGRALAFRHYGLGRARIKATLEGLEHAWVRGEIRPLTQAVLNVVLNAEQSMADPQTEGRLTLVVAQEGERVLLTVDDSGPGGASDAVVRMEPALALGPVNRLGLGLATASAIVARFGGALTVGESPEAGTRVQISLPAAPPAGA